MKAVVIGGCGHIGTYLVPMLAEEGYDVVAVSRGISKPYEDHPAWERVEKLRMDRAAEPDFARKIAALNADVVVDLINFSVNTTKEMVAALKGTACRHYLFCSSCWVHGRAEVLPVTNNGDLNPLCAYGVDKLASERYLQQEYRDNGFPATCVRPGQISGPGWDIISPWGTYGYEPIQRIANGEELVLPNFGMETLHHVHGYDVAQCFFKAITHRENALGQVFEGASGNSITLYGYAKLLYDFFGKEPKIRFVPWQEWCDEVGDPKECETAYLHFARSGSYSVERERQLLDYQPRFSNVDTIQMAVQSYVDRGIVQTK